MQSVQARYKVDILQPELYAPLHSLLYCLYPSHTHSKLFYIRIYFIPTTKRLSLLRFPSICMFFLLLYYLPREFHLLWCSLPWVFFFYFQPCNSIYFTMQLILHCMFIILLDFDVLKLKGF
jgi:hypothetical protein